VGFAAINTGNNLLYLLVGAILGFIVLSSWLSEKTIQRLEIQRRVPRGVTVGHPVRISYHVWNRKKRIPTLATFLTEAGLPGSAFLSRVGAGDTATVKSENHFIHRGVYPLDALTLSTAFPFGMFTKKRDVHLPGELVIWPRSDRQVSLPLSPGGHGRPRQVAAVQGAAGARGEYRSLREYRPGDDPNDIHWRSTARRGQPVVKEYDQDAGEALWFCLDTRTEPGERAEGAIQTVASLAATAVSEGRRFAVATPHRQVEPGQGSGQLERVLDLLARVDVGLDQPDVSPPAGSDHCVLVSVLRGTGAGSGGLRRGFGARIEAGVWK
jgi:uncharacterized protein (DUF58 family)